MDNTKSLGRLQIMPDNEKLCYDVAKKSSNIVDFEPILLRYGRINFGSVADQVLKRKVIPAEWTTPYEYPAPRMTVATETAPSVPIEFDNLQVSILLAADKKRDDQIAKWKDDVLPRFISFLELCLHTTAVSRITNVKDADWKNAIESMDILAVHKIMVESHTFLQGGVGYKDNSEVKIEHATFGYIPPESLQSYIHRYTRLRERMTTCGVKDVDDKEIVYRFVQGLKPYSKSVTIKTKLTDMLAVVDTDEFPTNLEAVQQKLLAYDREDNPEEQKVTKAGSNPFATVNMATNATAPTASDKKIRMFADGKSVGYQEPDGTFRVFTAKGISRKMKYEPGTNNSDGNSKNNGPQQSDNKNKSSGGKPNSKTPYTDRFVANQIKKTGKTKNEILSELECRKCGRKHRVVAKDCTSEVKTNSAAPGGLVLNSAALMASEGPSFETVEYSDEEIIETPMHLRGFFNTMDMAHGLSKQMSPEQMDLQERQKLKNYNSVNLDDHANIHLFCNKRLLTDVKRLKDPVRIAGIGGMSIEVSQLGQHPLLGDVLYEPKNGYNIMSLDLLEEMGYEDRKATDKKTRYLYNAATKSLITFHKDPIDRFWKCPVESFDAELLRLFPVVATAHREMYCYPMSAYYTVEQQRRAQEAIQLHQALDHPSDKALKALLGSPSMINVPITAQDLANARAIYGPCPHCLEGKPKPHVGTHQTFDPGGEPTKPGQLLHMDIVYINGKPRLFVVDHVSGKCDLIMMPSKSKASCCDALETIIHSYRSHLKVVQMVSCDSERSLIACETFLNGLGVKLALRIPYEHEKIAERHIRILREKMEVKMKELPYRLPYELYDALAVDCVRCINLVPNGRSMPYTPMEMVTDVKFNYLTDFNVPFGMPVLVESNAGKKQMSGTANPQDTGFCLGPAVNAKGGIWVYIPDRQEALVRRMLQPMPMTNQLINFMNNWHDSKPPEGEMLKFTETMEYSESGAEGTQDEFDRFVKEMQIKVEGQTSVDRVRQPAPFSTPSNSTRVEDSTPVVIPTTSRQESTSLQDSGVGASAPSPNPPEQVPPTMPDIPPTSPIVPNVPKSPVKREIRSEENVRRSSRIAGKHVETYSNKRNSINISAEQVYSFAAYLTERYEFQGSTDKLPYGRGEVYAAAGNIAVKAALRSDHAKEAKEAISKELLQLLKLKAWKYLRNLGQADASVHKNITPCSMFLKKKHDAQGTFLLWKARLVGGGHRTDPNAFEPFETHSPTIPMEVAMMQLGVASFEKAMVETFDIPCAYLNASLKPDRKQLMRFNKDLSEILVEIDPEAKKYLQPDGTILVQVEKALYGFPESAKLWNEYMTAALIQAGYKQSKAEACLFKKSAEINGKTEWSTITIYVDDCLHTYNSERLKRDLYAKLRDANLPIPTVQVLNLANSISYLGMNISMKGPGHYFVSQPGYVKEIIEEFQPKRSYPTPSDMNIFKRPESELTGELVDMTSYLSKLMKLMFLATRTRPDLLPTLSALSSKARSPNTFDMARLNRVLGYLLDTQELGINVQVREMKIYGYCDASWACHQDLKGHTGIIITMGYNGLPIYCKSHKQKVVSRSSTEAELIALYTGVDILLYLRRLLHFMGYLSTEPITILQDNTSTITMAYMGKTGSGSNYKYMDIKYFWIKEYLDNRVFQLKYLNTDAMLADLMASPRMGSVFRSMRNTLLGYEK